MKYVVVPVIKKQFYMVEYLADRVTKRSCPGCDLCINEKNIVLCVCKITICNTKQRLAYVSERKWDCQHMTGDMLSL
jgi:hypothetical protein